jgi:hypothetical protein
VSHGFVRHANGELSSFDPPGSVDTHPVSIGSRGAITGYCHESNNVVHGFVRQAGGTIASFDVVPGSKGATYPASTNDVGAITGNYVASQYRSAGFVSDAHGQCALFDPDSLTNSVGINNEGATAGEFTDIDGEDYGNFVRSPDGTITRFLAPFCALPYPTSINDVGAITGYCNSSSTLNTVGLLRGLGGTPRAQESTIPIPSSQSQSMAA